MYPVHTLLYVVVPERFLCNHYCFCLAKFCFYPFIWKININKSMPLSFSHTLFLFLGAEGENEG